MMMMMTRVAIYIDGSNLYHSLKNISNRTDLNFTKFIDRLVDGRALVRAYYYNAIVDNPPLSTQSFISSLHSIDYLEVKLGKLEQDNSNGLSRFHEKRVDTKIVTDMLVHSFNKTYDVAILVSGDTDFVDAVQAVKNNGQHVEVAISDNLVSRSLREVADKIISLNRVFLEDLWIDNKIEYHENK